MEETPDNAQHHERCPTFDAQNAELGLIDEKSSKAEIHGHKKCKRLNAMNKPKTSSLKLIADNKKAFFNYFVQERFEAGIVLEGWEVKAAREGKAQITDGFVMIKNEEVFMMGCQISPLKTTSSHVNAQSLRSKKLLLKKSEIKRLIGKTEQKGYTLVVLNLHWKQGKIKAEIGLAKGKAHYDKREVIKEREVKREVERILKTRYR